MALTLTNLGEEWFLQLSLNLGNYTMKLYQNNATAGLTAAQKDLLVNANFTEATFTGYAAKTLTAPGWSTSGTDPRTAVYAQQTWTRTSTGTAQLIYGYTVHRVSDGLLCWFEEFAGPISTSTNGDTIIITPTMTMDDNQEATVAARGLTGTQFSSTSNSSGYTATGLTDMVMNNFDADATRNYRIHLSASMLLNGSGTWLAYLNIDGTRTERLGIITGSGGLNYDFLSTACLWQPSTAQYDLAIEVFESSGTATLTFEAASDSPRRFWLEDIGPR